MGNNLYRGDCNKKHYIRDNKYGVTWCLRCGKLLNKSSGREISEEDRKKFNLSEEIL